MHVPTRYYSLYTSIIKVKLHQFEISFSSGFPTSALLTFWPDHVCSGGYSVHRTHIVALVPLNGGKHTFRHWHMLWGQGTGHPELRVTYLTEWDPGVILILKPYSACYPRYQIPALSGLAFLSQSISHSGASVILCALSACVRESKGRYLLILFLKIPHWLNFWKTNDSKGKCWYFRGIYTLFLVKKI